MQVPASAKEQRLNILFIFVTGPGYLLNPRFGRPGVSRGLVPQSRNRFNSSIGPASPLAHVAIFKSRQALLILADESALDLVSSNATTPWNCLLGNERPIK